MTFTQRFLLALLQRTPICAQVLLQHSNKEALAQTTHRSDIYKGKV